MKELVDDSCERLNRYRERATKERSESLLRKAIRKSFGGVPSDESIFPPFNNSSEDESISAENIKN